MEIVAVVDPITRIEGHMKIMVEMDTVNGASQVTNVQATGNLFRGFEKVLVGRDPRDAQHITQRICGVCPVAHSMTAVLALDDASGVSVPNNARLMRNLVNGANFVESHILHFFLLSVPDFIDGPGMMPWQPSWQSDRRFSAAENSLLIGHYLQAIEIRRKAHEMGALFGGRLPHPPAYIPGGFTATPRPERISAFKAYLAELIPFIQDVYLPDVELLAARYTDYFALGTKPGNLVSFGVFELDGGGVNKLLAPGFYTSSAPGISPLDAGGITEHILHSWYDNATNGLHPAQGETEAVRPKADAYSWVKAPRYNGFSTEVGPLARMVATGEYSNGISVIDRHRARALEALKIALAMQTWVDELDPDGSVYNEPVIPAEGAGEGLSEAPRGALGHWVRIADGKIAGYQVISPTTWNSSPRDSSNVPGPIEQALLGAPVENVDEPIELLRIIHSFDPCLDCAVHVVRPKAGATVSISVPAGRPIDPRPDSKKGTAT